MKFCKKCKHVFEDEQVRCEGCKKDLEDITDATEPVFVASIGGYDKTRAAAALHDANIPFFERQHKKSASCEALTGEDKFDTDIMIPAAAYESAFELLAGIGIIELEGAEIIDGESADADFAEADETETEAETIVKSEPKHEEKNPFTNLHEKDASSQNATEVNTNGQAGNSEADAENTDIKTQPEAIFSGEAEPQPKEMSSSKRFWVRVLSVILLIGIIAAVVYGTDFIMELIKNLFK